jgi:glycine cleavage system transcriptional repressor
MSRFAVAVFGRDRPGIVAAITRVLADSGCNLEDTSMTILRGHFAMMLVVAGPAARTAQELERGLELVAGRLDLQVSVRPVADEVTITGDRGMRYVAAVYGADRPGLVAQVSEALAAREVNIVDLQTRVIGEPDPVYAMHFELQVPSGQAAQVEADLHAVADALGVQASFGPDEADVL